MHPIFSRIVFIIFTWTLSSLSLFIGLLPSRRIMAETGTPRFYTDLVSNMEDHMSRIYRSMIEIENTLDARLQLMKAFEIHIEDFRHRIQELLDERRLCIPKRKQ